MQSMHDIYLVIITIDRPIQMEIEVVFNKRLENMLVELLLYFWLRKYYNLPQVRNTWTYMAVIAILNQRSGKYIIKFFQSL